MSAADGLPVWHRLPADEARLNLRLPLDKLWAVSPSNREAAATNYPNPQCV